MIPRTVATWQSQTWQEQLINLVRDPQELCRLLELDYADFCEHFEQHPNLRDRGSTSQLLPGIQAALASFPLKVSHSFIERMEKGNLNDPLLLQVLPQAEEALAIDGYSVDPLAESAANRAPGIIQKYRGRVLFMVSSACAVHCRYCFRRHFPYAEHRQSRADWQAALDELSKDDSVREVIFSGGDPLSVSNKQLSWLTEQIAAMPHVHTLRIHTRLPIIIPDRIDQGCLEWLDQSRLKIVMVIHSNHPNELDDAVQNALVKIGQCNVTLLNQAVLLRNVNDRVEILADLSEKLFKAGVVPYYLHLQDKVQGTHHLDLSESTAVQLHQQLKARLPGKLVPKLAKEIPGEANKLVLG